MSKTKSQRQDDAGLRGRIVRLWKLVQLLNASPRGLSNAQLERSLGVSRATLYRDLTVLKAAGVVVLTDTVNGEARHRLEQEQVPALTPTALQLLAIRVARTVLAPLEGLSLVKELDALLGHTRGPAMEMAIDLGGPSPPAVPGVTTLIEQGLQQQRRLRFDYLSPTSDRASQRVVDPIGLRVVEGHLYLIAFDVDKQAARTFKALRMTGVEVLPEAAMAHPEVDEAALFTDSVKAWAGPAYDVVIRIPARLAGVADEWPLIHGQQVEDQGDGAALVKARVAGLVEAMRWVLRWGADAEAIEPPELRQIVVSELARAHHQYHGDILWGEQHGRG